VEQVVFGDGRTAQIPHSRCASFHEGWRRAIFRAPLGCVVRSGTTRAIRRLRTPLFRLGFLDRSLVSTSSMWGKPGGTGQTAGASIFIRRGAEVAKFFTRRSVALGATIIRCIPDCRHPRLGDNPSSRKNVYRRAVSASARFEHDTGWRSCSRLRHKVRWWCARQKVGTTRDCLRKIQ
jgi:hypothetical protein